MFLGDAMEFQVLDLIFPFFEECVYCNKPILRADGAYLCKDCKKQLNKIDLSCDICSYPLSSTMQTVCNDCVLRDSSMSEFYALYLMDESSKRAIHSYKYGHNRYLSNFYADILTKGILEKYPNLGFDGICFVPSTKKKIRERGFDHIYDIVTLVSVNLNIKIFKFLTRVKHLKSQASMDKVERANEIKNSFSIKKIKNMPKKVLLVDDIYTTGATMEEVSKLLNSADISVSGVTIYRSKKSTYKTKDI